MLDKLQNSDFLPYLSQTFRVHLEGMEPIELELVHVTEAGKGPHLRRDNHSRSSYFEFHYCLAGNLPGKKLI